MQVIGLFYIANWLAYSIAMLKEKIPVMLQIKLM